MCLKFVKKLCLVSFIVLMTTVFVAAKCTNCIIGKVRDHKGKPLADVSITARQNGKNLRSTTTNKKGKFELTNLKEGSYNLVFEKIGFSSGLLTNVLVRDRKRNNLKNRLRMSVDQGTLVIVEASVFNQNGFSLYGAKVVIEEILSDGTTKKVGSGYSSKDGDVVFRFPEKNAKYRVTASVKGLSAVKEIEVNEAAIYRTAITLDLSKDRK